MDRRSFLGTFLQAASGIVIAGASLLTFKTQRHIKPLSIKRGAGGTLIALPEGWESCNEPGGYLGPCNPDAQALICPHFQGPCTHEVVCNDVTYGSCDQTDYYVPDCPEFDACPSFSPCPSH